MKRYTKLGLIFGLLAGITLLSGCESPFTKKETVIEPTYYLSEEELAENSYYIVREVTYETSSLTGEAETVTETRYYPLLQAETVFKTTVDTIQGYDSSRITWVNSDVDEDMIPTMYQGDTMIFKSSTLIPEKYTLEKFFDNGYTVGVEGLVQDLSGNYRYYGNDNSMNPSYTMSTSDATGFDLLDDAESIYFIQIGDQRVTPLNVSLSGTIRGLEKGETYECDIRRGTQKIDAVLTANIHYFSSAETYLFGSYTFITPTVAQINIPEYATTGYYNLNNGGFYRYIADENVTDYTTLSATDYNTTIYTYDEDGIVDGTSVGLVFDENKFLVSGEREIDQYSLKEYGLTYDEYINKQEENNTITNPTSLIPDNDIYSGTYTVTEISDPIGADSKLTYTLKAQNVSNGEILDMKYTKSASLSELTVGNTYDFTFKEGGTEFDGYIIITVTDKNKNEEETEIDTEEIEPETETDELGTELETES